MNPETNLQTPPQTPPPPASGSAESRTANPVAGLSAPVQRGLHALLIGLCLLPALWHLWAFQADALGANPIEALTRAGGEWTLNFLLLTLAVTPLRRLTGAHWLLRFRRTLGLFTFAYASLHLGLYVGLDQYFAWAQIADDLLQRPFIAVGFAAFVLLIPLAATSSHRAMRQLGGRRWQALHRSIYPIAILAVLHFWWLTKADYLRPWIYTLLLVALLGLRAWWREAERRRQLAAPPPLPRMAGKIIPIVPKE